MTQESVIQALQNGSLTSYQIEDLTGIPRLSYCGLLAQHLQPQEEESLLEKIKLGRSWVCKYTLAATHG
jgi:hypothetical protein